MNRTETGRPDTGISSAGRQVTDRSDIWILAAAHKRAYAPGNRMIHLIQTGSALAAERLPGMLHDDEGENISGQNRSYCELTAQYYAWKNLEADYYGFFHYRRYMNFAKEYPPGAAGMRRYRQQAPYTEADSLRTDLTKYALDEQHMQAVVEKYDVITVLAEHMNVSVYEQFCQFHDRAALDRMIAILKKQRPEYAAACDAYMHSRYIYFCNMYIMKREYFRAYMEWLFPLLEEFEAGKDGGRCGQSKMRMAGYLAERLFGVYYTRLIWQRKARCCELQYVIFHRKIRRFRLWKNGPELAVDMRKINRLLPAGSLRRRAVRTFVYWCRHAGQSMAEEKGMRCGMHVSKDTRGEVK